MKNKELKNKKEYTPGINHKNIKEFNKKAQLENELNIQRGRKKNKNGPSLSDMKMNQLNYYNEIAKNNIHNLMNNPTLKDVIRITSNESVFDQLKAKEQSKDLSKFLDLMPLKRVERINYKCLEIGHMRKDLGLIKNPKPTFNKEKGKKFAVNLYEKRKREGSVNHIPNITLDNMNEYNENYKKNLLKEKIRQAHSSTNINNLTNYNNNESWIKKYKHNTHLVNKSMKIGNINFNNENKEEKNLKIDIDNLSLASDKIFVNKYKKTYETKNSIDKEKSNEKINNKNRNKRFSAQSENSTNSLYTVNNTHNNNYNKNNHKGVISSNISEDKTNLKKRQNQYIQNEQKEQNKIDINVKRNNYKKYNSNYCSRKNLLKNNISIADVNTKPKNSNWINVKQSFMNDHEEKGNKVKKNEEFNNSKKNLIKNNPGYNSHTYKRFKSVKI